jgi:hypothetical protein
MHELNEIRCLKKGVGTGVDVDYKLINISP